VIQIVFANALIAMLMATVVIAYVIVLLHICLVLVMKHYNQSVWIQHVIVYALVHQPGPLYLDIPMGCQSMNYVLIFVIVLVLMEWNMIPSIRNGYLEGPNT
jgi:hypothetical protein